MTQKHRVAILLVCAGLISAASALAGTQAGQNEVRLEGAIQNVSYGSSDSTSVSGQVVFNRFLRDSLSVGLTLRPTIQTSSSDGGDDSTMAQLFFLGRGDFYLTAGDAPMVPYVGAHAGLISYEYDSGSSESESGTVLTYGLQGGLKYFVTETTSFNVELDLSLYSADSDGGEDDVTVVSFYVGYSVYF